MNAKTFCEHFATFAEAPNGVEKLRELILQLAVQGKLVPQDENDTAAWALRREMESARQRMIDDGEIRCGDGFAPVGAEETPYALPEKWEWVRIGEVMHLINGKAFKPTDWLTSGLPIVRIQNLNNPDAQFNYAGDDVGDKVRLKNGDFLISWSGTPGTSFGAFIWERGPAVLNQHIFRAILFGKAFIKPFLRIAVNARLDEMIAQAHGGVGLQHITKGKLERLSLPLPPIAEQRRIVVKVNQLLGLCDELAARQAARREARSALVGATLDRLVSSRSAAEFPAHTHRLRNHFGRLFDTPTTIPELFQAILQLAVQGQLVPQEPDDEPAALALERIGPIRQKLIAEKGIKDVENAPISDGEVEHDIPSSWAWKRLGEVCKLITDGTHLTPRYTEGGRIFLSAQNVKPFSFQPEKHRFVSEEDYEQYIRSKKAEFEDVLLTRVGAGIGEAAVIDRKLDFAFYVSLGLLRPFKECLDPYFLSLWLNSPIGRSHSRRKTYGKGVSQGNLNLSLIRAFVFPLPPLAEQKRIVAKVTELLSQCDALEAKLTEAESASTQLLSAAVHHLLNGTGLTAA